MQNNFLLVAQSNFTSPIIIAPQSSALRISPNVSPSYKNSSVLSQNVAKILNETQKKRKRNNGDSFLSLSLSLFAFRQSFNLIKTLEIK